MAWVEKRGNRHVGYYRDADGGKHRAGSDVSKRKALAMAQDEESKIRGGVWHDPRAGSMTFADYFEREWLPNKNVEVQTAQQYLGHYDNYLGPAFGSTPVNKITSAQVQRFIIGLEKLEGDEELLGSTIGNIFTTLKTCLGGRRGVSAVRDGLIRDSPCINITLPPTGDPEIQVYEVEEVAALMEAMPEWWRPIPIWLSETGMRWGEMLGVQLHDFEEGYSAVTVERTIERCTKAAAVRLDTQAGYRIKQRPKNRKRRRVALGPTVSTLVAQMVVERELFPMDRLFSSRGKNGKPKRTEAWPIGMPISNGSFRTQVWNPAHVKAGIPVRKIHALRASHITWLFDGGAQAPTVMRRVGHSSLVVTQRYLGAMADEDQRVLDALEVTKRRKSSG